MANRVLIAVAIVVAALKITNTPYRPCSDGAQFVHVLLGPATVALLLPLWRQWDELERGTLSLLYGLVAGSLTAIASPWPSPARWAAFPRSLPCS